MAENTGSKQDKTLRQAQGQKSAIAEREEQTLAFWRENKIFEKTLEKDAPKGEFVFYDGPPFATGSPHYGHILAGTMKDVIPRFRTMQGFHVPRRWGWDCHGLPIENLVEKELNLKSKKDIEDYGIEKFNEAARSAVLRYDHEWKEVIPRTGRFVDMGSAYLTMDWTYSESIWWSFKMLYDKGLIYQGFKSMFLCPRCETTLSNFEVSQGYKDITDISVYVKFELEDDSLSTSSGQAKTYVLAWTTTPWTLPGNVALAVKSDIAYALVEVKGEKLILAKDRLSVLKDEYKIVKELSGKDLIGKKYKPLFDYYKDADLKNKENIWKMVGAEFVTTTDGTGVVHIAPAFGEDDYNLSLKENLPFIQHVGVDGKFKKEVADFAGQSVKPIDTKEDPNAHQKADVEIIKYLAGKGTLFAKEKIVHSYPHCWRCDTPLLNYASSSWFVKVADLKDKLVEENKKVRWVPSEIGEGRFGKWLENARDWAISRSRYWGAPLPVWICRECGEIEVVGSMADIKKRTKRNDYFVMRHGQAENNILSIVSDDTPKAHHLTDKGKEQVEAAANALKKNTIDVIYCSPLARTKETAEIVAKALGLPKESVIEDARLKELNGGAMTGRPVSEYRDSFSSYEERFTKTPAKGENYEDIKKRVGDFLYDVDSKHEGKTILVVTHEVVSWLLMSAASGQTEVEALKARSETVDYLDNAEVRPFDFSAIPHNKRYELDQHRPYIDEIVFTCSRCSGKMKRVPEVFDTWYESGSMPYSQIHYPFENKEAIDKKKFYPADFIAEGQDQTRGWFYSLLVLSTALFGKSPYKNVIVNGIILAENGQKMSKRLKNYPEVDYVLDRYGADAMRYYLLSSPVVHAEDLAFSEKGLDEVVKKVLMRLDNVYAFYALYADENVVVSTGSKNILDRWILARLAELGNTVTESLERYELDRAAKPFGQFVDDLSTWYLRRSRDRFKEESDDKKNALATMRSVLLELSKLMAPFMPFMAENLFQKSNAKAGSRLARIERAETEREAAEAAQVVSVHLENWPSFAKASAGEARILAEMAEVRTIVSLALEARAKAGIKVRQPLRELRIRNQELSASPDLVELIKDEVNVKSVAVDPKLETPVALDTEITDELKLEGQARDLIRSIQDLRKEAKLDPADLVSLIVETNDKGRELVSKFEPEIKKTAKLSVITFADNDGSTVQLDDFSLKLSIKK